MKQYLLFERIQDAINGKTWHYFLSHQKEECSQTRAIVDVKAILLKKKQILRINEIRSTVVTCTILGVRLLRFESQLCYLTFDLGKPPDFSMSLFPHLLGL